METEIIHLSALTFLAGVFCKIYDDLNDNNLFEKHSFLLKNKEYINEMLKGLHYILLTYASSKYIYPVLLISLTAITQYCFDKKAYEMPYEYSVTIIFLLFCVYLCFSHIEQFNTFISMTLMLFILVGGIYVVDIYLCPNTIEFGYKKLVLRFFASISILLLFLTNYFYKFCPDEVLYCWWWFFGYCLTSSCFQLYLIWNSEKNAIIKDKVNEELIVKDESVKHIATSAKV
jgi:hypothetical protein